MKLPKIGKKTAIVTSVIVLGLIGGVSAEVANQPKTGADTSPIVQEVNNHEVRISNNEKNIRDLQTKTSTPPASDTVTPTTTSNVPLTDTTAGVTTSTISATSTPQSVTAPTSAPVTVVSFREIIIDPDTSDCEYTYSDGTTYQFHWKTSNPQGSWATDGNGQNGHWIKAINTVGFCDKRAIGTIKLN